MEKKGKYWISLNQNNAAVVWLLIRGSLTGFRVSLSIGEPSILDRRIR